METFFFIGHRFSGYTWFSVLPERAANFGLAISYLRSSAAKFSFSDAQLCVSQLYLGTSYQLYQDMVKNKQRRLWISNK